MKSTYFQIGDKPFHALVAGDPANPCLIFLHGFPEYCGAWSDVIPHLADRFYCVAPDQRGYGQSWREGSVAEYAAKHLASDVIAMIDTFGGGQATLIGHDWGASVAYAVAMRAPDRVTRLVIANGVHPATFQKALASGGAQSAASQYIEWLRAPGSEEELAANNHEKMFGLFSRHMDMAWLSDQKRTEYAAAWGSAADVRGMVNWYRATPLKVAKPDQPIPASELPQWDPAALRITMPHLLLWGQGDTALLPEAREGLEDFCDDLTVVEFPGADHWIPHQKPKELVAEITTFLS
ncbi:MAG: alpha/beta hydrolase [Pseudomonadota bacterium]